jgi:sugar transferase EpsL
MGFYSRKIKRIFDFMLTVPMVFVLLPLLGLISLLVIVVMKTPILFEQLRPGLNGKPFKLYKFRTMTNDKNEKGELLPDEERLTKMGRLLRILSLDELPELFNVIKGDMSLVGPRPLLMRYLDHYTPAQARRHEVMPGITGWAQINGRNEIAWEEKFKLDVWYVDNISFWLDFKILLVTFWKLIKREGINQPGQATMEEFKGSLAHHE